MDNEYIKTSRLRGKRDRKTHTNKPFNGVKIRYNNERSNNKFDMKVVLKELSLIMKEKEKEIYE